MLVLWTDLLSSHKVITNYCKKKKKKSFNQTVHHPWSQDRALCVKEFSAVRPPNCPDEPNRGQKQVNHYWRGATEATSFIPTHDNRIRVYLWPAVFSKAATFQNKSNQETSDTQHEEQVIPGEDWSRLKHYCTTRQVLHIFNITTVNHCSHTWIWTFPTSRTVYNEEFIIKLRVWPSTGKTWGQK